LSKLQLPPSATLAIHPTRLLFLDGIRGILALAVALSHIYASLTGWDPHRPFGGGFFAVDCFFVMSGFVLTHTLTQKPDSWAGYFGRRWARLWPLHIASMALVLVILLNNRVNGLFLPEWWHQRFGLAVWVNIAMLQEFSWWQGVANQTLNLPAWSIAVEFWVSGLMLYPLVRGRGYVALCLSIAAYAALCWHASHPLQVVEGIGLPLSGGCLRGIGGIALGNAVYKLVTYLRRRPPITSVSVSYGKYVFLLPVAFLVYTGEDQYCWWMLVSFVLFIIVASLETRRDRILGSAVPVWLGEISFSVYLVHMPVLLWLQPGGYAHAVGNALAALYILALGVVLAALTHYGFEAPSRRYLYGLLRPRRQDHPHPCEPGDGIGQQPTSSLA